MRMLESVRAFSVRYSAAVFAFCLGLAFSAPSMAIVRCIDDVSQVTATLDAALASAEALEEVRFKQGNYLFDSGDYGYFGVVEGTNKTLWISGGWSGTPGNCTTQDGHPTSSLLWGLNQRNVFGINASTTFTGTTIVENMAFGAGYSDTNSSPPCLLLGEQNGGLMGIRVERVWVENCVSMTDPAINSPVVSLISSVALTLRNNVFVNNNAGVSVPVNFAVKGGVGFILNNTIANNTSANVNGFAGIAGGGSNGGVVTMANNIFDGNVATAASRIDVRIGEAVTLQNNRFTGLSGVPVANSGSTTGSAGFRAGSYELAITSTARDAGAFFIDLIQGDFDFNRTARVQNGVIDLGAFEFPMIFDGGFESN